MWSHWSHVNALSVHIGIWNIQSTSTIYLPQITNMDRLMSTNGLIQETLFNIGIPKLNNQQRRNRSGSSVSCLPLRKRKYTDNNILNCTYTEVFGWRRRRWHDFLPHDQWEPDHRLSSLVRIQALDFGVVSFDPVWSWRKQRRLRWLSRQLSVFLFSCFQ